MDQRRIRRIWNFERGFVGWKKLKRINRLSRSSGEGVVEEIGDIGRMGGVSFKGF